MKEGLVAAPREHEPRGTCGGPLVPARWATRRRSPYHQDTPTSATRVAARREMISPVGWLSIRSGSRGHPTTTDRGAVGTSQSDFFVRLGLGANRWADSHCGRRGLAGTPASGVLQPPGSELSPRRPGSQSKPEPHDLRDSGIPPDTLDVSEPKRAGSLHTVGVWSNRRAPAFSTTGHPQISPKRRPPRPAQCPHMPSDHGGRRLSACVVRGHAAASALRAASRRLYRGALLRTPRR